MAILLLLILIGKLMQRIEACPLPCVCVRDAINCVNKGLKTMNVEKIPVGTKRFYFSGNALSDEVLTDIVNFENITLLDLSYNNITELKYRQFQETLEEIYLDNNRITRIDQDAFGRTENSLIRLSLRSNLITSPISIVTFYAHKKLEYLDLSQNLIPSLEDNTVFPPSVKQLNLSHNPIPKVYYSTFKITTNLEVLNLEWMHVTTMKSSYFRKCKSLKKLTIGGQYLMEIASKTFMGLSSLETLALTDSKVTFLPTYVFENLPLLTVLDLRRNLFNYFEDGIFGNDTVAVKELYLEENFGSLRIKQSLFKSFRSLTYLSLKGNNITIFPGYLDKKLPYLEFLDLSFNKIVNLEKPQTIFSHLIGLDVSHNGISIMEDGFLSYFPDLQKLDVSGNNLSNITVDWSTASLTEIDGSNNKWICGCSIKRAFNTNVTMRCNETALLNRESTDGGSGNGDLDFCVICDGPDQYQGQIFSTDIANELEDCDVIIKSSQTNMLLYVLPAAIVVTCLIVFIVLKKRKNEKMMLNENYPNSKPSCLREQGGDVSLYEGIENVGQEYQIAEDHVYQSIKTKKVNYEGINEPATFTSPSQKTYAEDEYIDPIRYYSDQETDLNYDDTGVPMTGQSQDVSVYDNLPTPPLPPHVQSGVKSAYELDITASSYLDLNDTQPIAANIGFTSKNRYPDNEINGALNNAYELE